MSEMVERVARAIHDGPLGAYDYQFDGPSKHEQQCSEWCRDVARVAIEAMTQPTDAMCKAGEKACPEWETALPDGVWEHMIQEALR